MVVGIGTDIVEIQRITDAVTRWGSHFLSRVYTDAEQAYCMTKHSPYQSLAARFAAKEATIKALSPLRAEGGSVPALTDIEVLNDSTGRPHIRLYGPVRRILRNHTLHLSIAHEKHYAVASVVLARTGA
ncbi:MAG TPA: holo-ACP synthase [Dissulfurispiraceae bacterium]|nr:holo-ACP synthase [Dissulfurispiraceae bacterium]